jgi:hypothetical protein
MNWIISFTQSHQLLIGVVLGMLLPLLGLQLLIWHARLFHRASYSVWLLQNDLLRDIAEPYWIGDESGLKRIIVGSPCKAIEYLARTNDQRTESVAITALARSAVPRRSRLGASEPARALRRSCGVPTTRAPR